MKYIELLYSNSIGIGNRKSYIVNPKLEFTNDFVRGLIEGDGYIGISTSKLGYIKPVISFVTVSNELVLKYRNYLLLNNIKYCTYKQNNCYITVINGKETIKLINLIYPKDNQLYSKRKFDKSMEIINYYKNKENE